MPQGFPRYVCPENVLKFGSNNIPVIFDLKSGSVLQPLEKNDGRIPLTADRIDGISYIPKYSQISPRYVAKRPKAKN